eukprot:3731101-Rhodomonas_salina.7
MSEREAQRCTATTSFFTLAHAPGPRLGCSEAPAHPVPDSAAATTSPASHSFVSCLRPVVRPAIVPRHFDAAATSAQ